MKQKGFAQIFVVILLLILVGGGAYYFGAKKSNILPTPVPSQIVTNTPVPVTSTTKPTTDPTANWRTYTDSRHNFSFRYPEAVILEDKSVTSATNLILVAQSFREVNIIADKDDGSPYYLDSVATGKASVGELTGNTFFIPGGVCGGASCTSPIYAVVVVKNGIKYVFSAFVEKNANYFTDLEKQILSTFKFMQ